MASSATTVFDDFRTKMPLAAEWTFLNHAAVSPLPIPVTQAMENYLHMCQCPPRFADAMHASVDEARATMASLINASPAEIAFVTNTATGISIAASGLPLRSGDEVILTDMEYPANVYPWMNLNRRGVRVRIVPNDGGGLSLDAVMAAAGDHTRVVSVSSVEFLSGYRTNLAALGAFCRERGIYFVVDAIQSLGVIPMDVKAFQIDFLATGGPKWLLGPKGQGFLFCRNEIVNDVSPTLTGAGGVVGEDEYLKYDMTFLPDARRFHIGVLNGVGIAGLKAAVEMLMQVGVAGIERRVLSLTGLLIQELQKRDYRILGSPDPQRRSGIVTFEVPDADKLCARLMAHRVVASYRGDAQDRKYIRVSPHGYNHEGDVVRFLDALDMAAVAPN